MASAQPKYTLKIAPAVVIAYNAKKKQERGGESQIIGG